MAIAREYWKKSKPFRISREVMTGAEVVVVKLADGSSRGWGECCPTAHYGETVDQVVGQLEEVREAVESGAGRSDIQRMLPAGAARNALDCALWDLDAARANVPAWQLAHVAEPRPLLTAFTLGIDAPAAMAEEARRNADRPLLKIKLDGNADLDRLQAVREAAPRARFIVDSNEAWTIRELEAQAHRLAELGVELIEQPLPAGCDDGLTGRRFPVPLCADESCHTAADVAKLAGKYQYVNIKLDKTGGLTEALRLAQVAQDAGLGLMVGCMAGTSLAMAPALLVAGLCKYVDLDAPLLQAKDRDPGLRYEGSLVYPATRSLWG